MANDARAWKRLFVLQWHNASSLRASFLLQIFGMMINNGGIAVAWILFISVFGTVNGWGAIDILGVQGIGSLAFGLAYSVGHGAVVFANDIRTGRFDSYLLRPLRLLPLVWRSYFSESTFGDVLFGLLLIGIAAALSHAPIVTIVVALFLAIPGAMVMLAMSTITSSYAFWRPDDRLIGDMLMRIFMVPTMYPAGPFPPAMRVIYSVCIPSLLVAGIPWEAARDHAPLMIGIVWIAGFVWLGIAALVFRMGLKRYESGGGVG